MLAKSCGYCAIHAREEFDIILFGDHEAIPSVRVSVYRAVNFINYVALAQFPDVELVGLELCGLLGPVRPPEHTIRVFLVVRRVDYKIIWLRDLQEGLLQKGVVIRGDDD